MYKIPDFDSVNSEGVDHFKTIRGLGIDGNVVAYCKLPERNLMLQELEERLSSMLEPELTESEHDDIVFGRYVS